MDDSVGETAVIDDVHAHPHVNGAENALLVLLVLAGVVEEDPVEEVLFFETSDRVHLAGCLAVTAECRVLLHLAACQS